VLKWTMPIFLFNAPARSLPGHSTRYPSFGTSLFHVTFRQQKASTKTIFLFHVADEKPIRSISYREHAENTRNKRRGRRNPNALSLVFWATVAINDMRRDIITNKLDSKGAKVTDDTTHNGIGEWMKDVSWTSSTPKERP
jgi:hypothetical protein